MEFAGKRIFCFILVALLVGGLITVWLFTYVNAAPSETPTSSLYKKVVGLAADGDTVAKAKLQELHSFLRRRGKTFEEADGSRANNSTEVGDTRVFVKGLTPFYLKIYNNPHIRNLNSLNGYVASRKQVLEKLAAQNSNRTMEVDISPSEKITITQLWEMRNRYGIDIDDIYLDVLIDEKWAATLALSYEEDDGGKARIDFSKSRKEIEQQLREFVCSIPPSPMQNSSNKPDPQSISFGIQHVRGKIVAKNALYLQREASILLVDPTTDLRDAFANQAAEIYVVDMPHLYIMKRSLLGRSPIPSTQSGKLHGKRATSEASRIPQGVR